jgi:aspartyl-tRNA(Asn)/glutamyl-tRNA(Gln) amidotransferase subunit A
MIKKYLDKIGREDGKINSFLEVDKNASGGKGKLSGKAIAVKAIINVLGKTISCASKTLENYRAPYDASVIEAIKKEGGAIIGMTNLDEFACGWSGETSAFGATQNPVVSGLVAGGSSSGSAAAVSAGFCDMALGTDTGGSIRVPASHCGIVGVKPSYGSVSRYGLIDMCMSLDQIGPMAKNVSDAALLLSIIYGKDERDSISANAGKIDLKKIETIPKKLVVGFLDYEISNSEIQRRIFEIVEKAVKKYGWEMKKIKIPSIDLAIATYYPIVFTEFFSGTRKFDGRKYGKKIEEVCGPEVLRRILGGAEISKAEHGGRYYHQALNVRNILSQEINKIFKGVDCIISPTVPRLPHKIGESISMEEMMQYDALTCPYNLAGNCAISIPSGKIEGIPFGMQIACDKFEDEKMLQIARAFEKLGEGN